MKNPLIKTAQIILCLVTLCLLAAIANAQTSQGRMWVFGRDTANMTVIDRATGTELKVFNVGVDYPTPCNLPKYGGGVAYDPTDGNIWISILGGEGTCGDGWIHKIPPMGGPEIKRIPDPTKDWFFGSGIGALDYDPEENVLYAISFNQGNGTAPWIFKLDADSGAVLNSFTYPDPMATQMRTLAIDRPDRLGGRKVLIVSNNGGTVDIDTGAHIDRPLGVGRGWGIDVDEITGETISYFLGSSRGDISIEDGLRCDCKKIAKPPSEAVSSEWPESGLNWSMGVEVSENDGLVLHDVSLGPRYMAKKISVPYYTLETTALSKQRAELKPDGSSDPVASSQLINYRVFKDDQKLIIQATYLIDKIPSTTYPNSPSCLHITQRYEFYKSVPGDNCEPSAKLPCSRWKPIVKYQFFGSNGESLRSINIAQRQHRMTDNNAYNSVGLFRDNDYPTEVLQSGLDQFARRRNPLENEWYDSIITAGKDTHKWDNIHQTYAGVVDEPGIDWTLQNWSLGRPGCPECIHSHWRWGLITLLFNPEGKGSLIGIPPGSNQDVDFGVVAYQNGEEDPLVPFNDLVDGLVQYWQPIRTYNTSGRNPLQIYRDSAPEDVVYWQSATGYQNSDTFFAYGVFFNPEWPTQQLYGGSSPAAPIGKNETKTAGVASVESAGACDQDEISSIAACHVYLAGTTDIAPFDASIAGPLPAGYTQYNNLSFDVTTTAEASGPETVTFCVPSVNDQTVFNNLRVFHLEPDPYDPGGVLWVDRTVSAPDPQGPDFINKNINARTNLLGQFVVASLTDPQPPNTGVADIAVSSSHSPASAIVGNNLTYTLTVNNSGPQNATDVVFSNALSPQTRFVSVNSTQGRCAETDGSVVCKLDTIAAGNNAIVTIIVDALEDGVPLPAQGKTVSSTAFAKANEADANISNNASSESATILPDGNDAPAVNITSPSVGAPFVGPANINVNATATDGDGNVSQVDFYGDGDLIGTGMFSGPNQYSLTWNNVSFGTHSIIAVATDNLGKTNVSTGVNIFVNGLASVGISSPTNGQVFNRPANIVMSATATYSGGSISKVDFYANGALIGSGANTADQFSFTWNNAPSGSYALTAVATDNTGVLTSSVPVSLTVNDYPSISLTTPTDAALFTAPANINFSARASDIDGTVSKVTFYANGVQIGSRATVGAYDYNFTWSNTAAGTYVLTAVATDNCGATTTSNPVTVIVNAPPTVSLTSPASGAQFVTPTNITILSSATDTDGTISKVEFYANGVLKGIGTLAGTNQYSFTWTGANTGDYALAAVATDNRGATTTSASVPIKVNSPALFVTGSTTLTSSDSVVKTRLEALNYVVTVKAASAAATADANGKALVVISSTVTPSAVGTKFRTVLVPVVTWESGLYANMGMTSTANTSFGTTTKQTQVKIINSTHPMADGLLGQPAVTTSSGTLSWGKPNANAVSVATIVGDTTKIVIFGYEQGAVMPGLNAPARRVGLFMEDTTAVSFSSPGQRLFDAAIKWATGRI